MKKVLQSIKGLEKLPKTFVCVWLKELLGMLALNCPLKSINLRCKEGLTDLHLAKPSTP